MLGLRQSLVTSGKVGGGLVKTDIGSLGDPMDGGAILLLSPQIGDTGKSIAYTVIPSPQLITVGNITSYTATWEQCRDYAHSLIIPYKKATDENVVFVGNNQYNAGATYDTANFDPRFKIYPRLYMNGLNQGSDTIITYGNESLVGLANAINEVEPIYNAKYPNNQNTHLIREWWELYYRPNPAKYPIKFIWSSRLSPTSDFAYAFCVDDGNEYLFRVTEKHSFLIFRSFTYNTYVETEIIPESSPTAFVPAVANGKAQVSGGGTPTSAVYGFHDIPQETKKFPVEFEVICPYNASIGIYNIPVPFDKFKTTTSNQGFKNFDINQPPGITVNAALAYRDTSESGTSAGNYMLIPKVTLQHTPYYWGIGNQYATSFGQKTIKLPVGNTPGEIQYTFRFLLDMSTLPGFESFRSPAIIGPISLLDFKFKFPNYKESTPITYNKYKETTFGGSRNLYLINKSQTDFIAAISTNNSLAQRYFNVLMGNSI
jgi:hypothetical protein